MRLSELRRAVAEEFGAAHGAVLMRDQWISDLGSTCDEALASGVKPARVWVALCAEMDVPVSRRHGRGLLEPPV